MSTWKSTEPNTARPPRAGARSSIRRKMGTHDLRVVLAQLFVGDAELCRKVAAQVVERGIGALPEIGEHSLGAGGLQVQGDALLVAM